MVKKILEESYFGEKKKFANSNDTQKKLPPHPCSVPKSIQKQIVEYNIKSK